MENVLEEELQCAICQSFLEEGVTSRYCGHAYCRNCILHWLNVCKKFNCPIDRRVLRPENLVPVPRAVEAIIKEFKAYDKKMEEFAKGGAYPKQYIPYHGLAEIRDLTFRVFGVHGKDTERIFYLAKEDRTKLLGPNGEEQDRLITSGDKDDLITRWHCRSKKHPDTPEGKIECVIVGWHADVILNIYCTQIRMRKLGARVYLVGEAVREMEVLEEQITDPFPVSRKWPPPFCRCWTANGVSSAEVRYEMQREVWPSNRALPFDPREEPRGYEIPTPRHFPPAEPWRSEVRPGSYPRDLAVIPHNPAEQPTEPVRYSMVSRRRGFIRRLILRFFCLQ